PELFQEAGLPEPTEEWTYDDVVEAAQKLTKDTDGDGKVDQYGLWVAPYYEAILTPIDAFGGWPQDPSGTKAKFDDPNTIAGVRWVHDVYQKWKVAIANPSFDSRTQLWSSGKVAMVLSGIWEASYLGSETPEGKTMKLVPGPIGPSGHRGGFFGVNVFPIWRSSKHPYETWLWVKFLCSKEVGIEGMERIGEPGLRHDVFESPKIKNDPMVIPYLPLFKTVKPMPEPANGRLSEVWSAVGPILESIWLGKTSVEEGCAELQKKVQEIMDQPKPGL
ncbi:MAG: extracellular solute-binding protein, partial [Anaerolineae bacterium]|nr:extracellular solute-binding protein [Anaerolineae bacterium]